MHTDAIGTSGKPHSSGWRSAAASTVGNLLEWYDLLIFGFLSILISKQFFPSDDPYTALLSVTATTGAGMIFRPIGGILIGMYADRAGRRPALSLVIMLMTISTVILAVTPTYHQIGIAATVLVVLARILQGISAGGEFGTATALLVEQAGEKRKYLYGSWQMFAQGCGSFLSACVIASLTSIFTAETIDSWAWRIPFFIGLVIAPVGIYMRRTLVETKPVEKSRAGMKSILAETLKHHQRALVTATAMSSALNVMAYVIIFYLPIYAVTYLHLPVSVPFKVLVVAGIVRMFIVPLSGYLADRVGGVVILRVSLLMFIATIYPCFYWVISSPSTTSLTVVETIFAILVGFYQGPFSTFNANLFPANVRSTALSVSYNITASILGGVTPVLLTWLIHHSGNKFVPAHYCALFFAVGLAGLAFMRRSPPPGPAENTLPVTQ